MSERSHLIGLVDGVPTLIDDPWRRIDSAQEWDALLAGPPPHDRVLVPLELALAHPERLARGAHGIWLAPAEDPARAVPLFDRISVVGVEFPKFTDGRGYSTAYLLRERLGWRGEMRALGDILQDQLFALRRLGFDRFALRADRDPQAALAAFTPFSATYQGSVDDPRPHWARAGAGR